MQQNFDENANGKQASSSKLPLVIFMYYQTSKTMACRKYAALNMQIRWGLTEDNCQKKCNFL